MSYSLKGKTALITGASHGLGAYLAKFLAQKQAHVIAVGQTQGALEELDTHIRQKGGTLTLVPMDLSQLDNIDTLGVSVQQRFGNLDILISNAGVLSELTPLAHLEPHLWDQSIALNLTAHYRLIRIFDPLLRASPWAKALFVTCETARQNRPFWSHYAAAKAGMEALIYSYAKEIEKTSLNVHLVCPSFMDTKLYRTAFPGKDPKNVPSPSAYEHIFEKVLNPHHDYDEIYVSH